MKKTLSILLALVIIVSAGTITAFATNSDATVELTPGNLVIVDPTDPTVPVEYASIEPKDMDFGTHQITSTTMTMGTVGATPAGLLVSDPRGLPDGTWDVTLSMTSFEVAATPTLAGASIKLTVLGALIGPAVKQPTFNTVTIDAATPQVIAESGTKATGGSPGLWGQNWTPELTIPGGQATAASHEATLTWALVAGV